MRILSDKTHGHFFHHADRTDEDLLFQVLLDWGVTTKLAILFLLSGGKK